MSWSKANRTNENPTNDFRTVKQITLWMTERSSHRTHAPSERYTHTCTVYTYAMWDSKLSAPFMRFILLEFNPNENWE